jgi:hypothetical protein
MSSEAEAKLPSINRRRLEVFERWVVARSRFAMRLRDFA